MSSLTFTIVGDDRSGTAFTSVSKGLDGIANKLGGVEAKIRNFGRNVGAAVKPVAAVATALTGLALKGASAAGQFNRLAQLSNSSMAEFQRAAFAARTVGIEQEKLSDIYKDVNDKVGDFLATGGGELKDFFEKIGPKVGVTAEHFRNLSGPQALGLYVSSLEKAGVGQQQMTFFMEAIANDATALLPLLANNGAEFNRLGDEAARYGLLTKGAAEAGKSWREATGALTQSVNALGAALAETGIIDGVARMVKLIASGIGTVAGFARSIAGLGTTIVEFVNAPGATLREWGLSLKDWLGNTAVVAAGVANTAFNAVAKSIDTVFPGAGATITRWKDRVVQVFTSLASALPDLVSRAIGQVKTIAIGISESVKGVFRDLADSVKGIVADLVAMVKTFLNAISPKRTGAMASAVFEDLTDRIDQALPGAGDHIRSLKTMTGNALSAVAAPPKALLQSGYRIGAGIETPAEWAARTPLEFESLTVSPAKVSKSLETVAEWAARTPLEFESLTVSPGKASKAVEAAAVEALDAAVAALEPVSDVTAKELKRAADTATEAGDGFGLLSSMVAEADAMFRRFATSSGAATGVSGSLATTRVAVDATTRAVDEMDRAVSAALSVDTLTRAGSSKLEDLVKSSIEARDEVADMAKGLASDVVGSLRSMVTTGKVEFSRLEDAVVSIGERMRDRMLNSVLEPIEDGLVNLFQMALGGIAGGSAPAFTGSLTSLIGSAIGRSGNTAFDGSLSSLVASAGSGVSGAGSLFGSLFAGFFEDGGFIPPGQFGIAGEAGPEVVTGGRRGATVTPISAGGSAEINITINAPGADPAQLRRVEQSVMTLGQNMREILTEQDRRRGL